MLSPENANINQIKLKTLIKYKFKFQHTLCYTFLAIYSNMNDNPKNNVFMLENIRQKRQTILEYFDAYI